MRQVAASDAGWSTSAMAAPSPLIPLPDGWSALPKSGVLSAVALARHVLLEIVAGFLTGAAAAKIVAENALLKAEIAQLKTEIAVKDARFRRVPPARRPHFEGPERLAILELRAARGWTAAETARRFLVTEATIGAWFRRREEEGDAALVRARAPVNKFPDAVTHVVQSLRATFPVLGTRKIADVLLRSGLHLADTTVRRMVKRPASAPPTDTRGDLEAKDTEEAKSTTSDRLVSAKYPHHVWHIDFSFVRTGFGLWVPWAWFANPMYWPFGWWVGAVVDHRSRAVVATRHWKTQPSAKQTVSLLDAAKRRVGRAPKHIVSDRGAQFQAEYLSWCDRAGVKPRFGAVGKHGSIAIIERFWRSMKQECFYRIGLPLLAHAGFGRELGLYVEWYNRHRPHRALDAATPAEILSGKLPATKRPRIEPRPKMPIARDGPGERCATRVAHLSLVVDRKLGAAELPVVHLRYAA